MSTVTDLSELLQLFDRPRTEHVPTGPSSTPGMATSRLPSLRDARRTERAELDLPTLPPMPAELRALRAVDRDAYLAGLFYWRERIVKGIRPKSARYRSVEQLAEDADMSRTTFYRALARAKEAVPAIR